MNLTHRQAQVLDFIRVTIRTRGYAPTLREIGDHMGIRSTNGVSDHLAALERKGAIRRERNKNGITVGRAGLRVLADGGKPTAADRWRALDPGEAGEFVAMLRELGTDMPEIPYRLAAEVLAELGRSAL